jgi:hypothetical protein
MKVKNLLFLSAMLLLSSPNVVAGPPTGGDSGSVGGTSVSMPTWAIPAGVTLAAGAAGWATSKWGKSYLKDCPWFMEFSNIVAGTEADYLLDHMEWVTGFLGYVYMTNQWEWFWAGLDTHAQVALWIDLARTVKDVYHGGDLSAVNKTRVMGNFIKMHLVRHADFGDMNDAPLLHNMFWTPAP